MPAALPAYGESKAEGRPLAGRKQPNGRYSPNMGSRPATRGRKTRVAHRVSQISPAALDHRLPVLFALDRDHHLPRGLPCFLFDLPVDAEQGADALYRPRQFQLSAVARCFLDGDVAIGDLRAVRRLLQSPYRPDHRALDQQSTGQGPAQVARHAAGTLGHSPGSVVAWLVVAVRSDPFRVQ